MIDDGAVDNGLHFQFRHVRPPRSGPVTAGLPGRRRRFQPAGNNRHRVWSPSPAQSRPPGAGDGGSSGWKSGRF